MNTVSCCSSCSSAKAGSVFPLGSYVPYQPGYGHSFNSFNPVGVAGPNMGIPVARPYHGAPLPVGSGPIPYRRGDGNPNPYYKLPAFNSFYSSGDPAGFNPLSTYPSPSNPTGAMNPLGESMPANIGHPYRVGEGIGGQVESLGSIFDYVERSFHTMGAVFAVQPVRPQQPLNPGWTAPAKCKAMYVNCNNPKMKSDCCPPGTPGYLGGPQTIICPDGWDSRTPVGAQTFVDPCRGHYCPSVMPPVCKPPRQLITQFGPAPCYTPNYTCTNNITAGPKTR